MAAFHTGVCASVESTEQSVPAPRPTKQTNDMELKKGVVVQILYEYFVQYSYISLSWPPHRVLDREVRFQKRVKRHPQTLVHLSLIPSPGAPPAKPRGQDATPRARRGLLSASPRELRLYERSTVRGPDRHILADSSRASGSVSACVQWLGLKMCPRRDEGLPRPRATRPGSVGMVKVWPGRGADKR